MATQKERNHDSRHRRRMSRFAPHRLGMMPISAVIRGDELILDLDLPGVRSDDVDVTVERNILQFKASRRPPAGVEGDLIRDERSFGDWCRQLLLKSDDATVRNVRLENGVLTVTIHVGTVSGGAGPQIPRTLLEDLPVEPAVLYESLIESAEAQVELVEELRQATRSERRESVSLTTPTGELTYTLPLSLAATYSSTDVGKILSPTGQPHRSIAQSRRQANELLGIKIANKYRYPKFQINRDRREIVDVVKYANSRLECDADPWGALDWWYSEEESLDDRRPVDLVVNDELTEQLVDVAIDSGRQSME